MSRYQRGILVGGILSVLLAGAMVFILNGERRRQLSHRLEELRKTLPDRKQLRQSARQAANKARKAGNDLGEQMQESANKVSKRTQKALSAAQQTVTSLGENLQAKSADFVREMKDRV